MSSNKVFIVIIKFLLASICFVFAGYVGSYAFYDLNSTAADIHVALAIFLIIGGFLVACIDI